MLKNIKRSLKDLLGTEYMEAVKSVAVEINGMNEEEADFLINEEVEFFPDDYVARMHEMAKKTGEKVVSGFDDSMAGAPTEAYRKATHLNAAPIGGVGCTRIGQDGRAYLIAKSEHYHTSVGHNFPGYKLITNARKLGILNATHNNTRGYITRLAERKIIAAANGCNSEIELDLILASKEPHVLNRIINLETGSLAVEAGIKMMLSRFYRLDASFDAPIYEGKIPVFLVMEDNKEGLTANYHGTTIFAQTLRGMWPTLYEKCVENNLYRVVSVKKNDITDFAEKIKKYNSGKYKTAGFLHEIILMNYSGIRLTVDFLQEAYKLCREYDTFTLCDEIQSCIRGRPYIYEQTDKHFILKAEDKSLYIFVYNLGQRGSEHVVTNGSGVINHTFSGIKEKIKEIRWMDEPDYELEFKQKGDTLSVVFPGAPYGCSYCVRVAKVITE